MSKVRTTLTIDEEVLRAGRRCAGLWTGKGDSEVIEEALRGALGFDLLERVWARNDDLTEDDAMALALEAQEYARRRR